MIGPAQKYFSLQVLRAFAAWVVVFHHYMQHYFHFTPSTLFGSFFSYYGAMGVDIFFVISGFVVYLLAAKVDRTPGQFMIDRVFRIAPIYWFYSALVVACIYLFPSGFSYTNFTTESLLASALFIPFSNPAGQGQFPILVVGWTLIFEMFFYTSLACCRVISSRHYFKILFAAFAVLPFVYPKPFYFGSIAGSFKLYEFLAGAVLAYVWQSRFLISIIRRHNVAISCATALFVLASIRVLTLYHERLPLALSVVIFSLVCEPYLRESSRAVKFLVKLGDESYSTYLVHLIVIGIMVNFTGTHLTPWAQYFALLAITCSVYVASSCSYRWLERNEHMDALRKALIARLDSKRDPLRAQAR